MSYLLEYNELSSQFHYNYLETNGDWHRMPFSYGWRPIAPISERIMTKREFMALLEELSESKGSFEKVSCVILSLLLENE